MSASIMTGGIEYPVTSHVVCMELAKTALAASALPVMSINLMLIGIIISTHANTTA